MPPGSPSTAARLQAGEIAAVFAGQVIDPEVAARVGAAPGRRVAGGDDWRLDLVEIVGFSNDPVVSSSPSEA